MNNSKYLYHGSPKKLIGKKLNPAKGEDLEKRPDNEVFGVYASDLKDAAIAMAIMGCNGVMGGSLDSEAKPCGTIYGGTPNQKYIYLHTLPAEEFIKSKNTGHQYVCPRSIEPLKTERLLVKDYMCNIRIAGQEETKKWNDKYKEKSRPLSKENKAALGLE